MDKVGFNPQVKVTSTEGAKEAVPTEGTYRGERITQLKDVQSLIADAAEELTFVASEKVEKNLSKRRISSRESRIEKLKEVYEKYLRQVPDIGSPEKLNEFLEHLKKSSLNSTSQLREHLERFFKDVSHGYAALSFCEEVLKQEGADEELLRLIGQTKEEMMQEAGPQIKAGLNISSVAFEFSQQGLGDVSSLREFYRDNILAYEGLSKLHEEILNRFRENDFEQTITFLIEACGNDLRSQGPSISPAQLRQIIDDLYRLEVIGNFHRDCKELIEKTERLYQEKIAMSAGRLAGKVLQLKEESWLSAIKVKDIVNATGLSKVESKIFFLTELRETTRRIPIKAFTENENRDRLLEVMQEALDEFIEMEEI